MLNKAQERLLSRLKNRSKNKKIGIQIAMSEEVKTKRMLERIADIYVAKSKEDAFIKKFRKENKKG